MDKQAKQQALLQQLGSLANQPQEQACYALELLKQERGIQVMSATLGVVGTVALLETILNTCPPSVWM